MTVHSNICKNFGTMLKNPERPTPEEIRKRIAAVRPDAVGLATNKHEHLEARALECDSYEQFTGKVKHDTRRLASYREVWRRVRGNHA